MEPINTLRIDPATLTGTVCGHDPGGEHGLAFLQLRQGVPTACTCQTVGHPQAVLNAAAARPDLIGYAVDTLTRWSTGRCGWRPEDRWLRQRYNNPGVCNSVVSPNSIFGSMAVGGMAVLHELRAARPELVVTESHPKVEYFATTGAIYSQVPLQQKIQQLATSLQLPAAALGVSDEHQYDALRSAWAWLQGCTGQWTLDLHLLPPANGERLVGPAGPVHYFWP